MTFLGINSHDTDTDTDIDNLNPKLYISNSNLQLLKYQIW